RVPQQAERSLSLFVEILPRAGVNINVEPGKRPDVLPLGFLRDVPEDRVHVEVAIPSLPLLFQPSEELVLLPRAERAGLDALSFHVDGSEGPRPFWFPALQEFQRLTIIRLHGDSLPLAGVRQTTSSTSSEA